MAQSPSHKFGQQLGKLLEDIVLYDILKPRLQQFAQVKNYYLDWQRFICQSLFYWLMIHFGQNEESLPSYLKD